MIKMLRVSTVSFVALLLGATPVWAESPADMDADEPRIYEIEVVAPRLTRELEERREGHRTIRVVERDAFVGYEDLDLTQPEGMEELESRVTEVARELCNSLAIDYPVGQPDPVECLRRAVDDAMAQVREQTEESPEF